MADETYLASCENLTNPGDNYTMTVTSISNDQENSAEIVLTAGKNTQSTLPVCFDELGSISSFKMYDWLERELR